MPTVYCVEDDASIRELVLYALSAGGFEAQGFEDGASMQWALDKATPDLLLLDIMLPDEDGLSILSRIRKAPKTQKLPVIMLTAKGSEYDKVKGLDAGADDYVTKPFGVMELLSRVRAVLRRAGVEEPPEHLQLGAIRVDTAAHTVFSDGRDVTLTHKEYELLVTLLHNAGHVLSREQLMQKVWGYDFEGESRTVDVHVKTLRQKLGAGGAQVKTVRGAGYKLEERG